MCTASVSGACPGSWPCWDGVAALVVGRHHRLEDTFRLEGAEAFAGGPHDYADTIGKDHGCIEIRGGWTTGDPAYLAPVDPDREGCDRARLVGVRMQTPRRRPSHDRCPHLHRQPAPKARPLRQAVRQHRSIENVHHGVWKWPWARTTAAYTRATPPTQDPPQAHGPQPAAAGPVPRMDIAHKRMAAAWNKDYLCQRIGLKPKPISMQSSWVHLQSAGKYRQTAVK